MARIFIEVEMKGLHHKFEFETDDKIMCMDLKSKIIREIENINQSYRFIPELTSIFSPSHCMQLDERKSLKENGVVSGDILFII